MDAELMPTEEVAENEIRQLRSIEAAEVCMMCWVEV